MPGVTLGFLKYVLGFDSLSFRKGVSQADADLVKLQKSFAATGQKLASAGKTMTLGLTLPLTAFAAKGIKEAQETSAAMAQVTSALTSTGGAAGKTADQLTRAADSFEMHSLYEGDQILSQVTAKLLAFGNVTGATFDRAQQAIVDYASRSGKDLSAATLLIGKALNDPAKAMGVLGKAGITLSAEQQKLVQQFVATGNAAGAQGILLDALTTKFGGAAQAAQDADAWNAVTDAFNSIAESLGTLLLPLIKPLADGLASLAKRFQELDPTTKTWVAGLVGVVAATGPVLTVTGNLIMVVGKIGPAVTALSTAWGALRTAMIAARVAALATLPALTPFLAPLAAIAVAVGGVYLAWKNWDAISAIVQRLYTSVKTWLMDKLGAVIDWVKKKVASLAEPFKWVDDVVVRHSYVPDMVTDVGLWMAKLPDLMGKPVDAAVARVNAAFSGMGETVPGTLAAPTMDAVEAVDGTMPLTVAPQQAGGLLGGLQRVRDIWSEIGDVGNSAIGSMAGGILDKLIPAIETLQSKTATLQDKFAAVGALVTDLFGKIFGKKAGKIFGALSEAGLRIYGALAGARANGGPVSGGRAYLVGERGPEIFAPTSSGRIIANDRISGFGGNQRIHIVPSKYFDVVVDARAKAITGPAAARAAYAGAAGGLAGVNRQGRRRLA